MAEKSLKHEKAFLYPTVIATISACSIMLLRILGIVMVFNPHLLGILLIPIVSMFITSMGFLWWLRHRSVTTSVVMTEIHESPFQVGPALKFAGFVILIKFFSTLALVYQESFSRLISHMTHSLSLGSSLDHLPLYVVSVFSGLADVDAITQQMSELSNMNNTAHLPTLVATITIIIAIVVNTAVKIGLAKKFGSQQYGVYVFRILSVILAVGVISVSILSLINFL